MEWMARSADPERGQEAQTYARHVLGVLAHAGRNLEPLVPLLPSTVLNALRAALFPAAEFHDLGKLDDDNQPILRGNRRNKPLPIVHSDAGVVELLRERRIQAALLVASHHVGLPNIVAEQNRGADFFRVEEPSKRMREPLELLLARHREALAGRVSDTQSSLPEGMTETPEVFLRMALSCLVDADHADSSNPNRPLDDIAGEHQPPLLPGRRLEALDAYVAAFRPESERDALRGAIYAACRGQTPDERIVECDSPVGSGKTTAVMAHLLAVARKRGLRRIFVVLPFTNIIRQSAEVYRKALVLPGENPSEIVAEVHHLADFEDDASRDFAARWNAPIVVTTAVAFFETLAAARPSALRRLHELAGSAVFVDEAHAALPAKLLPIAWRWIQALADEWNVHWVLASGSLVRFWEMPEIRDAGRSGRASPARTVPMLAPWETRSKAASYETERVRFETLEAPLTVSALLKCVAESPGPRLVILNTVQNAAVVAKAFADSGQFDAVFHLSTALTPADRANALEEIKNRLKSDPDGNWVLVGTSCIEAGVNLDFATGFREMASLSSLLQASGRINRDGRRRNAIMYSFCFSAVPGLNRHPGLEDSIRVLQGFFSRKLSVSADLCTEALRAELLLDPSSENKLDKLSDAEDVRNFPEVERLFKVISSDTKTVVVDSGIVDRIASFQPVDWRDIQRNSVQLWGNKLEQLRVPEIPGHPGCFKWHLDYSPFLGCMEGILKYSQFVQAGGGVL